jgi:hypothetical protein
LRFGAMAVAGRRRPRVYGSASAGSSMWISPLNITRRLDRRPVVEVELNN